MENFNTEQRYATDFDDLAFFHRQYQRLMAHWREVLPIRMLDFPYETSVADTIYSTSVGHWHAYAAHLPELPSAFPAAAESPAR